MFLNLFYTLRHAGVPVSVTEWMTLVEALDQGHAHSNLTSLYYLSRAILVKSEAFFDQFDQSFAHVFKDAEMPKNIRDEILEWLADPANKLTLSKEELDRMKALGLDELRREFEKRLQEQDEAHNGGNRWIGTGGTSPFGHSGANPAGMRVGGPGGGGTAVKIAGLRKFRNYRNDLTLDVRQMKMAMKRLRQLEREGPEDELDIDGTIDKTCRDGGEIDLVFRRPRKNTVKVLLLMDSGGSMNPYSRLVSQLFSAAHQMSHFRDFKHYYFHNCVYQELYKDIRNFDGEPTGSVLKNMGPEYKVIIVGDACMAPSELFSIGGVIDYYSHNDTSGIEWLRRIAEHFRYCAWLNPLPERAWFHTTIQPIARLIPMFPLTLDGLEQAMQKLVVRH